MDTSDSLYSLDEFMMKYYPYRGGENNDYDSGTLVFIKGGTVYDIDRKDEFISRISNWLEKKVKKIIDKDEKIIVTIAPGHKKDEKPTGFMHDIVTKLAKKCPAMVIDGGQQLIRTKGVEKSATTPGLRSMKKHEGTIEINGKPDNEGKVVIILDDVWTSGSTLSACKKVMRDTKPKEVKLFAIGKTV